MQPFRNCLSGAVQLARSCRGFASKFFKIRAKKVPPSFAAVEKSLAGGWRSILLWRFARDKRGAVAMGGLVPCSGAARPSVADDPKGHERRAERSVEGFWRARQIGGRLLTATLAQVKRLLSSDHFSVDGTLIEAWASASAARTEMTESGGRDAASTSRSAPTARRGVRPTSSTACQVFVRAPRPSGRFPSKAAG
jgi:hypothetical protein